MADSDAVRARRRRAHQRGDHRDCSPRCAERRVAAAASMPAADSVTAAVAAFAAAVTGWKDDDPRRTELALARQLAARLDAGGGDWRLAELLVSMMRSLAAGVEDAPTVIDELRAQEAAGRVAAMARTAQVLPLPGRTDAAG